MSDQPKLPPGWSDDPEVEPVTPDAQPLPMSPAQGPETIRDYCDAYLAENPRITSSQTGRRYYTTLNTWLDFLERDVRLDELTPKLFAAWVEHRRGQRVAAGTVRGDAEKFVCLWRWAGQQAGVPMPMVKLPPKTAKTPEAWVPAEVEKLDRAARDADWWLGGVPANLYWPALIGVAIDTGERHAAIHHLRASDIDLDRRVVTFRAETRKGNATDNRKELSAQTVHDLRLLLAKSPDEPFNVVKLASTYPAMRRLLMAAGMQSGRNNMFHAFRRYHATQVAIAGGDPTSSLGHADPSLARKSYVDPTQLPQHQPRRRAGLWGRLTRSLRGTA